MIARVVSGGQTGVDRAALDAARSAGLELGGWCPPGRASDGGPIPEAYPLQETPHDRSAAAPDLPRSLRTEWNVRDADATLVIRPADAPVDAGTEWTIRCATSTGRPLLVCDPEGPGTTQRVRDWLASAGVRTLNVAGPSEAQLPGIAGRARGLLDAVFSGAAPEEGVRELARLLERSRRAVVFTGAGVSTESGIPDFRSPGGLWSRQRPIDFAEFMASEEARREAWRRRFAIDPTFAAARPNRGHRAIAELVRRGLVTTVVTQNIDGLHQASGVGEDRVVELHGNTMRARCLECGRRHELAEVRVAFERDGLAPRCTACGGIVKTATISFGQRMPEEALRRAAAATLGCDLFVAAGSSLVVYPAASFPVLARRNGATLVILNREPTPLDEEADLVLHLEIGPTLGAAVGVS